MNEEDKAVRRHDLCGSAALDLIEGEADGNASVEKSASLTQDVPERYNSAIGTALLHEEPGPLIGADVDWWSIDLFGPLDRGGNQVLVREDHVALSWTRGARP